MSGHPRQKSTGHISAAPASGSAIIPAVTTNKSSNSKRLSKQISASKEPASQQWMPDSGEAILSDRIYHDGGLSSASRLSQLDPTNKNDKADEDLVSGIEMMAPAADKFRSVQPNVKPFESQSTQQKQRKPIQAVDLHKDEGVVRDENMLMELMGLGGDTGGNQQSSSAFDELDFTKTTADDLLIQVIEQTLKAYSVDEKLASLEVINLLDTEAVERLKTVMIEPLLKNCPPQLWSTNIIDLGNYPINPWLNNEIFFHSQVDEIQQGTIFLEGTYELKQRDDGKTVKAFINSFDQPDDTDSTHVVRFTDCSTQLDLGSWEFDHTDFLVFNKVTADDMIGFIAQINERIHAPRSKQVLQTKLLLSYILIGFIFMAIFISMIAVWLSGWLSVFVILSYFLGLFLIQRRTGKISSEMEKAVFFNLAFAIHNLNKTTLEQKYKMRCKLGHLGQWVEFHSLKRRDPKLDEQSKSDQVGLIDEEEEITLPKKSEKLRRIAPEIPPESPQLIKERSSLEP